jgi:hypothetical protein
MISIGIYAVSGGPLPVLERRGFFIFHTCMDEHLLLGDPFDAPKPSNIGEALDYCKAKTVKK